MNDGQALIVQGDALHLPLPDGSVDLIVTSPPYFALRAYSAGPGEIGSEPTPAAYLEALWAATAEMVRVLKPSGSLFVDLGDSYYSGKGAPGATTVDAKSPARTIRRTTRSPLDYGLDYPRKSLMLLPERYRIGCVDRLGLIAREVIIWRKPNGLPESVRDRCRREHEDWVHLVRQPRYYAATDEVREPQQSIGQRHEGRSFYQNGHPSTEDRGANRAASERMLNPLGKLPGSVWTVPSEPLRLPEHLGVQHYASFPSEWPRRLILGWSPPGICLECGQGRVPVVERSAGVPDELRRLYREDSPDRHRRLGGQKHQDWLDAHPATILGYACSCTPHTDHPGSGEDNGQHGGIGNNTDGRYPDVGVSSPAGGTGHLGNRPKVGPWREYHLDRWQAPPTRPAVILDPFSGTGTVPMVARALGRIGVGVDLSAAYCRAARWRVRHDGGKAISRTNLERQGSLL